MIVDLEVNMIVLLSSCLILGLCLLECSLNFITVVGIYYEEN